jgi:hypothetical protein
MLFYYCPSLVPELKLWLRVASETEYNVEEVHGGETGTSSLSGRFRRRHSSDSATDEVICYFNMRIPISEYPTAYKLIQDDSKLAVIIFVAFDTDAICACRILRVRVDFSGILFASLPRMGTQNLAILAFALEPES